jgi:hypothetical protein
VAQGQGYYLRGRQSLRLAESQPALLETPAANVTPIDSLDAQRWRIFQAMFERCAVDDNSFVFPLARPQADAASRSAAWTVPDAVVLEWNAGELTENGFVLKPELLPVLDRPFDLTSVRLALEASPSTIHELVFQTLSSGAWAHRSELVLAASIADQALADELRSLGDRYGIAVTTMGIEVHDLGGWQSPAEIHALGDREIETLQSALALHRLCKPALRHHPEANRLLEVRERAPEIAHLFTWIHRCLTDKRAYTFEAYRQLG